MLLCMSNGFVSLLNTFSFKKITNLLLSRFMREERLRDDLDTARRQRLDLESALLERDARAMENRFDLEARTAETERLRRRLRELEMLSKQSSAGPLDSARVGKKGIDGIGSNRGGGGASTKREKELEDVVEAMKRVIDKLKAENERFKKTGGPDERKASDALKTAGIEKKKAEALREEVL